MASDLEEGEIVEEGEEVRRGNNGQGTKTSARATCRKTRKKSIGGRSSGEKQKTVRNGLGVSSSVAQDLHRQRKIRRDAPPPRRHVAALHESSREKIVISVNSRATRSTNRSCDKQVSSDHHAERKNNRAVHSREPIRRNNWGNGQRNEGQQRQTSRWHHTNSPPSPPRERKEIKESSDDDNASVISVEVPPKTPPPLIVLEDSDEEELNNDEDVEVLQLRKAALEGLMAKLGREARESASRQNPQNKEEDEPYSPPDDDFQKAQNIENIFPDGDQEKTEFPSVHQPPASFLPLREPNQYNMLQEIRNADKSNQEVVASSSSFTTTTMYTSAADRLYPPLGTGDVDMRLMNYPTSIAVASEANIVPPNPPAVVSQPRALVQYPLFHNRGGNGCYGGTRMVPAPVMPPSVPFGFGNPTMPGYNLMNNYVDPRPWQQFQPVQQNVTQFGFPCPVPSPHIVLPTPSFGSSVMQSAASLPRIPRPTVFPDMVPPRPLIQSSSDAPQPVNIAGEFKNDVDDRSTILIPKQMSISPPSSPPPEELETLASPVDPEVIPSRTPPRESSPKAKEQKDRSRSSHSRNRSREKRTESKDSRSRRSSSKRASRRSSTRKHSSSPAARRHSSQRSRGQEQEVQVSEVIVPEEPGVSVPPAKEQLLEENIVISVCNEKVVPPPQEEATHADDSLIEDEDMLRAKLLLELAKKKQISEALEPSASTSSTTTTTVAPSTKPTPDTSAAKAAVPAASYFSFPLQGTGATITKTILNPRSKNRQIVRVVNNSSGISSFATRPNFGLRKTINNATKPIRPNLHNIQRTVINTNLLKKNVYNQNADPLMWHVKITVPNKVTPLIIPAGADSSTDDESSVEGSPAKNTKGSEKMNVLASRSSAAAESQNKSNSSAALPVGFEDSLNSLLRSSREQIKPSARLPPKTLKHLTLEKQAEYLRLKSQLEHYHRLIEKKTAKKEAGANVSTSVNKSGVAPLSHKSTTASSGLSKKQQVTKDGATTTEMNIASSSVPKTTVFIPDAHTTHKVPSASVSLATGGAGVTISAVGEDALASESASDIHMSPLHNNETLASISSKEKMGSIIRLNGSRRNSMDEMLKGILDSADEEVGQDVELQDINEAKLLASDEESDTTVGTTAADLVEEGKDSGTESMEVDVLPEKPFVVDAAKEREELYLREKLLKAQLLKKMEASNERLKLRKLERNIMSSRKDINRELTSLLSEMVKLSDLKVKMKTQEDKVLMLREQLYAAEQQLNSTVNKIQTYEGRRKNLTSRVIDMRKGCVELVKECRKHGQKVEENYQVPSSGALEMKSKLIEVRNQNLVFRRENQKLKSQSPRKQALARKLGQQSATLAAANRVKRSFHLMGRRLPVTSGVKKIPSTPQQLKFYARKPAMNKKGRHFEKTTGYLTKHGKESPEDWDDESVFLLPRMRFKDILTQEEKPPLPRGRIPILPYSVYESPLNSIREHGHSDSSTPGLVRNLDPFVTLCYFELRAMCNSVKCAFQHLYRPAKRKEDSQ